MQVGFLDFYGGVLGVREDRTALLANNIANADTPNYKALDVPFDAALASQLAGTELGGDASAPAAAGPLYRANGTVGLNGNDVSLDTERVESAANGEAMAGAVIFLRQSTVDLVTALRPNPGGV
jgi:flagellar basal-body rod protein FlgB